MLYIICSYFWSSNSSTCRYCIDMCVRRVITIVNGQVVLECIIVKPKYISLPNSRRHARLCVFCKHLSNYLCSEILFQLVRVGQLKRLLVLHWLPTSVNIRQILVPLCIMLLATPCHNDALTESVVQYFPCALIWSIVAILKFLMFWLFSCHINAFRLELILYLFLD